MISDEVSREFETPKTYQEALKSTCAKYWSKACGDEIISIK